METKNEALELAQQDEKLAGIMRVVPRFAPVLRAQAAEIERLRDDYTRACKLVADMHMAAMGGVIGPVLGVIEDVEALRIERDLWKSNHDAQVQRSRVLKERTDMPLERVKAYEQIGELQTEIGQMKGELQRVYAVTRSHAELTFKAEAERDQLKAKNEKLADALSEITAMHGQWNNGMYTATIASKALKENT